MITQVLNYMINYHWTGCEGLGRTSSLVASEQNSLIFLYKYQCLLRDKPAGTMISGRSLADGIGLVVGFEEVRYDQKQVARWHHIYAMLIH